MREHNLHSLLSGMITRLVSPYHASMHIAASLIDHYVRITDSAIHVQYHAFFGYKTRSKYKTSVILLFFDKTLESVRIENTPANKLSFSQLAEVSNVRYLNM